MSAGLKIAVADDEALIRRYFVDILPDLGHQVLAAAADGRQLVEACTSMPVDLVITDIRMPEMDGIEAAVEICLQCPTPIILVSGYHDEDLIQRAGQTHIMAYLVKPIEKADLATAIPLARQRFEQIQQLEVETGRLRQSLEDRKLIEKAKGLLMKGTGLGEEEAFRSMQTISNNKNQKLVEIARQILAAESTIDHFRP